MPRKKVKKAIAKRQKSPSKYFHLKIVIGISSLFVASFIATSLMSQESYKVLGTTTYLAASGSGSDGDGSSGSNSGSGSSDSDDNDDEGSEDNTGSSNSGSGSGSGSSGSSSNGSSGSSKSSDGSNTSTVSDSTRVLCTGPDGKQFETKRKDCEELNRAWNKPVNFTVLPNKSQTVKTETRTRTTVSSVNSTISDATEVEDDDSGIRTKTETKAGEEKTEVKLSVTERIRTITKDGRTRIDITSGGIKTRYEIRDGRVIVKVEQEDGTEAELADDTLLKIDERLAKDNIKIATTGAESFLVQRGATGAVTDFPISVDLATNTLFISTPNGQKQLTVLPEQAVQNLIASNVVNRLGGKVILNEAINNKFTSASQLITLGERNGIPVYEVIGISDQKLLGFIPVQIEKEVAVSAETGNAVSIEQSFGSKILDAISF